MKLVPFVLIATSTLLTLSCQKNNEMADTPPYSVGVTMLVENTQGLNLLAPTTPGYFKDGEIKKYDLVDGRLKLYYDGKLDWYNGYHIVTPKEMGNLNTNYYLTVFPNIESKENPTTTYIDWGNGDRDTLICGMKKNSGGNYYYTENVWYNGEKVWPEKAISAVGDRSFKIVK